MLVKDRMSLPVISIYPDMTTHDALDLMRSKKISHLPVVDHSNFLIGIVSEHDLLIDSPSDVVSLIKWELGYLRNKTIVHKIMRRDVLAVEEDTSLEEAALIMAENEGRCLIVVHDRKVTGIITETDLLNGFTELLGAREPGIHVDTLVPDRPGVLARLTKAISDIGGKIVSLEAFTGDMLEYREVCFKVSGIDLWTLKKTIKPIVTHIIGIHEPQLPEIAEL